MGKESRPEEERVRHAFCVMKQTEQGEREDGSACGKHFEEDKQTNLEGLDGICRRSR